MLLVVIFGICCFSRYCEYESSTWIGNKSRRLHTFLSILFYFSAFLSIMPSLSTSSSLSTPTSNRLDERLLCLNLKSPPIRQRHCVPSHPERQTREQQCCPFFLLERFRQRHVRSSVRCFKCLSGSLHQPNCFLDLHHSNPQPAASMLTLDD